MKPVTLDADLCRHLGKIYVSGIAGVSIYHPVIRTGRLALCYLSSCGADVPEIILTRNVEGKVYDAVKSGKALAVVPVNVARKLEEKGIKIDGVLLYATKDFWHTLLDETPIKNHVDTLVVQFKGHVAMLRITGKMLLGFEPLLGEYQNVQLYYDYGLPDQAVMAIEEVNTLLLEKNQITDPLAVKVLEPVKINVKPEIAKYMKLIHPEAVTLTNNGVIISAFF